MNTKILIGFFATLLMGHSAFAERFIVKFLQDNTFATTSRDFSVRVQNHESVQNFELFNTGVIATRALNNVKMMIVDTDDAAAIVRLKNNPAVELVEQETFIPAPQPTGAIVPYDENAIPTTSGNLPRPWGIDAVKAPQAWAKSNEGRGARIAVLDTGVDKNHPALKDNFETGKDFSGSNDGAPYDYFDSVGHGTHVSGTIAGRKFDSGFSGVAPQAHFLMGRVCATDGCSSIAIIQGINWAISQKVDAISMSLGGAYPNSAQKKAVAAAEDAGIVVVAASGNDGTGTIGYPAAFPNVISVGAVDVHLQKADFSQWGPTLAIVAPGVDVISSVPQGTGLDSNVEVNDGSRSLVVASAPFDGSPEITTPLNKEVVFAGLGKPEDVKNVSGKIALIARGEIPFTDKVKAAVDAGAVGVIVYNNAPGLFRGTIKDPNGESAKIPAILVEQATGENLKAALAGGAKASATMATIRTDYSSYQGTSMATPHVAGVVALIKAAKKTLTPAQVRQIIKTTATALGPNDQNQYGAGIINAEAAVDAAAGM